MTPWTWTPRPHGHRTTAAVALAIALTAAIQQPAGAEPRTPTTLTEVKAELQRLYHDAEVATDKYNAVDVKVRAQERRVGTLRSRIQATESNLTRLNSLAGAAAAAQYRGGGLPAEVQFVLDDDPESALDNATLTRRAQQSTQELVKALRGTREKLRTRTDEASAELKRLENNRRTMSADRRTIEQHITAAKRLESSLAEKQREQLAALEAQEAADAQAEWVDTGILDQVGTQATPAGRKAIAYATKQLGKPYVWGAEGPDSFDCSGLTSQAWLAAGVTIPRTSELQWAQLKHVPIATMRPGDLIIYFSDASHVALYTGDGKIIQAPRPGRWVYVSPAASMEILGVVRPDA
ncbi:NlpC/P60 family protein [Streptomyces sp. NPDC092369]|uniref:C40 family peptidase n=1 Tax=Streptomyces sp. NPDC092369 TaxID=3366015 RepID=UPI003806C799